MRFQKVFLAGVAVVFLLSSCSDDTTAPPRDGMSFDIPFDFSLAEAPGRVAPGDTLNILASPFLAGTVVFSGASTPLVIQGAKDVGISSLGSGALIRFDDPKPGTHISNINFSGGDPAILVQGSGELTVDACTFFGGMVQVSGWGNGLALRVSGTLLRNAGSHAIEANGGTSLTAFGNSIDGAGASGIRIGSGSSALVNNCIIWRATDYGISCAGGTLSAGSGCNDIHAFGILGYEGCTPPAGDFSLDPLFCDPDNGDYAIASISPCAPLNSGGCDLIGAYLPNCVN